MNSKRIKKKLVSLRIPEEMNKQLAEYLAPKGMTKNSFILGLISRELERAAVNTRERQDVTA